MYKKHLDPCTNVPAHTLDEIKAKIQGGMLLRGIQKRYQDRTYIFWRLWRHEDTPSHHCTHSIRLNWFTLSAKITTRDFIIMRKDIFFFWLRWHSELWISRRTNKVEFYQKLTNQILSHTIHPDVNVCPLEEIAFENHSKFTQVTSKMYFWSILLHYISVDIDVLHPK